MDTTAKKIIAIDFDGTITLPSRYPITGKIRPQAIQVIKQLQERYTCCLWTCREGEELQEALDLLQQHGLQFEYVNSSPVKQQSRKVFADIYIDDKAFGTEIDWAEIYYTLL